ncbi:hypothetical protein LX16_3740 [Stackebrandtia albiflava]|uniref:DUF1684 domain-containing protein n=1 Tax=Stackebrandtia albiflava TaxID=406432 RepID=A0A562V523_9ACTN|nr:DUF1684 domain-containing protein [Stackebrandtia albiflava]TWJ12973.1 hypothetical protein LX16_3740 [Stackebrandtia albiflava]
MDLIAQWREWAAGRDAAIGAPDGPLSLTALEWLADEDTAHPPIPGRWRSDGGAVVVTASGSEGLSVDGVPIDGTVRLDTAAGDVRVSWGPRVVEAILRDGAAAIRVRDPEAPARAAFRGLPRYGFDAAWRLTGRYVPFAESREVTVGSVVEGVSHRDVVSGEVRFDVSGREHGLLAFGGPERLWLLFRDGTSGVTTAASARSLVLPPVEGDGTVIVDFNRAANLPCAFNDFSTCPVPLPENRLSVLVEAGERLPV